MTHECSPLPGCCDIHLLPLVLAASSNEKTVDQSVHEAVLVLLGSPWARKRKGARDSPTRRGRACVNRRIGTHIDVPLSRSRITRHVGETVGTRGANQTDNGSADCNIYPQHALQSHRPGPQREQNRKVTQANVALQVAAG